MLCMLPDIPNPPIMLPVSLLLLLLLLLLLSLLLLLLLLSLLLLLLLLLLLSVVPAGVKPRPTRVDEHGVKDWDEITVT